MTVLLVFMFRGYGTCTRKLCRNRILLIKRHHKVNGKYIVREIVLTLESNAHVYVFL